MTNEDQVIPKKRAAKETPSKSANKKPTRPTTKATTRSTTKATTKSTTNSATKASIDYADFASEMVAGNSTAGKILVLVESPAKTKSLDKYLGPKYINLATYGHVRDLPAKSGSIDPAQDFAIIWQNIEAKLDKLNRIIETVRKYKISQIYLATDPDREGEAISWHVYEILRHQYPHLSFKRVVFYEITKKAVLYAINNPRDLDMALVNAYLARLSLDYLVGFSVSPLLWRKLPGAKSAGRVQGVALRLLAEREHEIRIFKKEEYWSLHAHFMHHLQAQLFKIGTVKLGKMHFKQQAEVQSVIDALQQSTDAYLIQDIERKETQKSPPPPFTTSTLQQEASGRLRMAVGATMKAAQKLYEGITLNGEPTGLITYMRTDSTNISQDVLPDITQAVLKYYGPDYAVDKPRNFKNKIKNAQEAHEAIRPVNINLHPGKVKNLLSLEEYRLYKLIWQRTLATQMNNARYNATNLMIHKLDYVFKASATVCIHKGFMQVYVDSEATDIEAQESTNAEFTNAESTNNDGQDLVNSILSFMPQEGQVLDLEKLVPQQHFTQPPPRYTEASLVKNLEERGIGRPSTYQGIISLLQNRGYAKLTQRKFFVMDRGLLVTVFLLNFFRQYFEYDFTANLEEQLDEISNNNLEHKQVLQQFWQGFEAKVQSATTQPYNDFLQSIEQELQWLMQEQNLHTCPKCNQKLVLRFGKTKLFAGCQQYPECDYMVFIDSDGSAEGDYSENGDNSEASAGAALNKNGVLKVIESDEVNGDIILKKGPYGFYVEQTQITGTKRASVPRFLNVEELLPAQARLLLSMPKEIGEIENAMVKMGIGKYGPYLLYKGKYYSIKDQKLIFSMDLARANQLIKSMKTP